MMPNDLECYPLPLGSKFGSLIRLMTNKSHPIQLDRVWFNQDPKFKPLADKKDWAKVYPMPEKKEKEEEKEAVSILDIIDKK